jgi:hypothetical protein
MKSGGANREPQEGKPIEKSSFVPQKSGGPGDVGAPKKCLQGMLIRVAVRREDNPGGRTRCLIPLT